ncbi:hypothetical protein EAH89_29865 [Roseomonas nepalensis]|uniref:Uncharacterized protein n=1 Tax=Muricoccus nepalensis TaxID=1854500 RepID=A0A502EJ42_9PROT|nr:hypothetical protein [Roseomonas nepalensis]TPG37718.1 hypothetical protein EAH89_29865 [Roseomonas nepalensis]
MSEGFDPPEDDLDRLVAASIAGALEVMLRRSAAGDRLELIRTLRGQMEQVLAEAPVRGDLVRGIALRTRLAALFDAEFTRLEAAEEG